MKKLALILSGVIAGTGIIGVYAEDYSISCDNQLRTVTFTVNDCEQNGLVVYVEDGDKNIIAIGETEGGNGIQTAVLPIPSGATEGYYTAVAADCSKEVDVEYIPYTDRSKKIYISNAGDEERIISAVNTAAENSIGAVFKQYEKELNLSLDADYKPSCDAAFVNLKANKTYATFAEVMSDFNTAKAVGFFADASEEELKAGADKYKRAAGISYGDDYDSYKSDVWRVFAAVRSGITQTTDVKIIAAEWYSEAAAVAAVNCADRTTVPTVLEKYAVNLGIDYDKFKNISSETKRMNVIKAVTSKGFSSAAAVKTAYDSAVAGQTVSSGTPSGGGGGTSTPSSSKLPYNPLPQATDKPQEPIADNGFSDMQEDHWAYKAVKALSDDKIMTGYDDGTVKPDKSVTRAEFIKLLTVAVGLYEAGAVCDFGDVDDGAWYTEYVASAVKKGITTGYPDNTFRPNEQLTREDAAVMILRAAGIEGKKTELGFKDRDSISEYAQNAVGVLSEMGIINGFENGEFRPKETITRAQTAQIIFKLREGLK